MEIDFAELEDGSLAEMIEDPVIPTKSLLAVYKGGTVQYVEKWRNGDRVLIPLPRAGQVLKHIGLPAGSEPFVGLEELMGNVACFFESCLDVEVVWRMLMTAFVFSSWFREKLPVAPYLALLGPPAREKQRPCGFLACYAAAACLPRISLRLHSTMFLIALVRRS